MPACDAPWMFRLVTPIAPDDPVRSTPVMAVLIVTPFIVMPALPDPSIAAPEPALLTVRFWTRLPLARFMALPAPLLIVAAPKPKGSAWVPPVTTLVPVTLAGGAPRSTVAPLAKETIDW